MISSIFFRKKFLDKVETILHSPCNTPGKILEMTLVIDENLSRQMIQEVVPDLLGMLKRHSESFRNVRFNMVYWKDNEHIETKVLPMSVAMLEKTYQGYETCSVKKDFAILLEKLRIFHARSKLIILITDEMYEIRDDKEIMELMKPFLYRKFMKVVIGDSIEVK